MRAPAYRALFVSAVCAADLIILIGISGGPHRSLDYSTHNFGLAVHLNPYESGYGGRGNRFAKIDGGLVGPRWGRRMIR